MIGAWIAVIALMALPVAILVALLARSSFARDVFAFPWTPSRRAFAIASGLVAILCLAAELVLWILTGRTEIWGVSPTGIFGAYCLCAFCVRALYFWWKRSGRRGAGRGNQRGGAAESA